MSDIGFPLAAFFGCDTFANLAAGAGSMAVTTMVIFALAARRLERNYWGN
ncbi:MAG: hypothetical protein GTO14_19395 [Anaerolineales bacterium]|nr:hypothetical protein [Anaerolineales bacterium]